MIEHSALTTKVYEWLRESILGHSYRPGDKLDIQQLAEKLGVSRTPVKDAINRLAIEGLVVLHSRQGTYVATLTPETLRELFAVREMIERWAAERVTPAQLVANAALVADLREGCAELLAVPPGSFSHSAFVTLDRQLHSLIVELTGNGVLGEIYERVTARMWIGRIYYHDQDEAHRRSQVSHAEHGAIARAFAAGDPAALAAALLAHTRSSMGHTLTVLDRYPRAAREKRAPREAAPGRPARTA